MVKIKEFLSKFAPIIISFILVCFWFFMTSIQLFINDQSLTVVNEYISYESKSRDFYKPLLKGDKREFEYTANEDNLGIIRINFNTFNRVNDDKVLFRLKESGSQNWYYETELNSRAFTDLNLYPVGFPLIENSKGKTYVIEIQSLNGTETSSVAIRKDHFVLVSAYQFDKNRILSDQNYATYFLLAKTINSTKNNCLVFASSVYMFPFLFYMIWLFAERFFDKKAIVYNPIFAVLSITVIYDIFFIIGIFDLVHALISLIVLFMYIFLKKKSTSLYVAAIGLIILSLILMTTDSYYPTNKASIWAYLIVLVGLFNDFYEKTKHRFKHK